MPIVDLQRRMREVGRIRIGIQVESRGGKMRPEKLTTFRITSRTRELIDAAAQVYGGEVAQWANPSTGPEFEVITTTDRINVVVPPGQSLSQWYELWSAGGCERRCDGERMTNDEACLCPSDPDERRSQAAALKPTACKPVTRLSVLLPDLPDFGVFRLETHGYYAAVEMSGISAVLEEASRQGVFIPARLRLEQREKRVPGQATQKYAVPVLEAPGVRMSSLVSLTAGSTAPVEALPAGPITTSNGKPALTAGPDLPEASSFRPVPVTAAAATNATASVTTVTPARRERVDDDDRPERPRTPAQPEVAPEATVVAPVAASPEADGLVAASADGEIPTPKWTVEEFRLAAASVAGQRTQMRREIYDAAQALWPGRQVMHKGRPTELAMVEVKDWPLAGEEWYALALRLGLVDTAS